MLMIIAWILLLTSWSLMANQNDYYKIEGTQLTRFESNIQGKLFDYQIKSFRYISHANKADKHILMSHGYLDNCAYNKAIIKFFIELGYDVTCIDLPGHGKSSGRRGDIDSFDTYGFMYKQLIEDLDLRSYSKNIFFAHSTGNCGMIDLLLKGEELLFDKYIMASPLIKSYLYGLSSFAVGTLGRFLPYIPRKLRNKDSADYMAIYKEDPRPIKWLPLNWARRHIDWNNRIVKSKFISELPLYLIFGTNDTVINAEYNESFLLKHFPSSKVKKIRYSGHHFIFQKTEIKEDFLSHLSNVL